MASADARVEMTRSEYHAELSLELRAYNVAMGHGHESLFNRAANAIAVLMQENEVEQMPTTKDYMDAGMQIAEKHKANVLQIINEFGAPPEKALDGCLISLAADFMVVAQRMNQNTAPEPAK